MILLTGRSGADSVYLGWSGGANAPRTVLEE